MTVKLLAAPAVTVAGKPVMASDWALTGWTTIPDSVPVMLEEEARQLAADDPLLDR